MITISTNNHGFDREQMPEYRLYVEARDNDGMGNSAQVIYTLICFIQFEITETSYLISGSVNTKND